jgi:CBS-domain-containing membrane protein
VTSHKSNPPKTFRAEYNAVKNHMHNTLGITKEDIQQIIKETVQTEIQKIYNRNYLEMTIERIVKAEIYGAYRGYSYWQKDAFKNKVTNLLTSQVAETIANQLKIDVQVSKDI